jgi:hypothetical protein
LALDPTTGQLAFLPAPGKGFTCASFVLRIFETYGLSLLAEDEWPVDANSDWQRGIVQNLQQHSQASDGHVEAVSSDVGCRRFSPEEVVGAAAVTDWPVHYVEAVALASQVMAELQRAA